MAHQAFVQQLTQHILRTTSEVGTEAVGKQKSGTRGYATGKDRISGWTKTDWRNLRVRFGVTIQLPAPVGIRGVVDACIVQVAHQWLVTLLQFQLQSFKFFLGHKCNSCSYVHYCACKGTTKLQLLQRVFQRMLTQQGAAPASAAPPP